ncbi:MAG: HEAT repeat domain-containing protein [Deltaproteobacteria bacterium]|nr:HEAT repeat domain-containing protein [Deltaproteobacteria bacterium]
MSCRLVPALLVLAAAVPPGCRDAEEGRGISAATESAGSRPVSEEPRGPEGREVCRPAHVRTRCVSAGTSAWLPEPAVERVVGQALERRFGQTDASSAALAVEYALRFSQGEGAGTAFLGIGGRLHGSSPTGPIDLREEVAADIPWPVECSMSPPGPAGGACRDRLEDALAAPVERMVGHLATRCELRSCDRRQTGRLLGSDDEWERIEAVRSVGECRFEGMAEGLIPLLDSPDARVALAALAALGQTGWAGGVAAIVRRSQAADERIQRAAAQALADIGTAQALRYLNDWARYHPDPSIRDLCAELVRNEGGAERRGPQ